MRVLIVRRNTFAIHSALNEVSLQLQVVACDGTNLRRAFGGRFREFLDGSRTARHDVVKTVIQ